MSEEKKKICRDEREAMSMDMDRDLFAQLPTSLIHTILSFLITTKEIRSQRFKFMDTKEAAQTIILSKTFLQAWSTFPDLYFTDLAFSKSLKYHPQNAAQASNARNTRERFASYVLHTVTSYQQHNVPIRRLHLTACLQEGDAGVRLFPPSIKEDGMIANILDQSIRKANENGVKEVYLRLKLIRPSNFLQTIFALKPLVSLILSSCDLVKNDVQDSDIFINCSSLRMLKLDEVTINEALLQKLIHSCPLIEKMKLYSCEPIETIQIADLPHLKKLKVFSIMNQRVDVKAASLEIMIYGTRYQLNIESAQSLKILKFICADITDALFHNLIANCPVLEELTLRNCDVIQKINVSSHSLSFLSIIVCRDLTEVKIDAPILSMFEYHGNRVLSPLSFANGGSGERKSCVTLYWIDLEEVPSFLELSEFLMTFNHTDKVSLIFDTTEISFDRNIMDVLRDENNIPEFDEVHIEVSIPEFDEVSSPSSIYSTIMEGLLWSFSPKVISVKRDSKFIMYLCEELLVQHDDHPNISTSASDCWRNYFKQAKFKDKDRDDDHPNISTSASDCWRNYFKQAKFKDKDRDDEWRPLHSWNNLADVLENLGDQYILKLSHG